MGITDILNFIGLLLNISRSILLGVSLSKYLTSMHGAIVIHDMQIQSLIKQDNRILTDI